MIKVKNYVLIFPKTIKPNNQFEFFKIEKEFKTRLSEVRRQKINVMPIVEIEDSTKKTGYSWIKFSEYKSRLKEEGYAEKD